MGEYAKNPVNHEGICKKTVASALLVPCLLFCVNVQAQLVDPQNPATGPAGRSAGQTGAAAQAAQSAVDTRNALVQGEGSQVPDATAPGSIHVAIDVDTDYDSAYTSVVLQLPPPSQWKANGVLEGARLVMEGEATATAVNLPPLEYNWSVFEGGPWDGWSILTISRPVSTGLDNDVFHGSVYFLADKERKTFQTVVAAPGNVQYFLKPDTKSEAWRALPKLFKDPLSLTASEWQSMQNTFINGAPLDFSRSFTRTYVGRVMDVLAQKPRYDFGGFNPLSVLTYSRVNLLSKDKVDLLKRAESMWGSFTKDMQRTWLQNAWSGGSGEAMEITSRMVRRFFDDEFLKTGTLYYFKHGEVLTLQNSLIEIFKSPGVSSDEKKKLAESVIKMTVADRACGENACGAILNFINSTILMNDGLGISAADYAQPIRDFVSALLDRPSVGLDWVPTLLTDFAPYIDPGRTAKLSTLIRNAVSAPAVLYNSIVTNLLKILSINHPALGAPERALIKERFMSVGFSSWTPNDMLIMLQNQEFVITDPEIQAKFFKNITAFLESQVAARAANPYFSDMFDMALVSLVRTMKKSSATSAYSYLLLPIIRAMNPRQPSESAGDYAVRLNKVSQLWTSGGIIVFDTSGGMVNGAVGKGKFTVDYLDVIGEFAREHPLWADVVILSTQERGKAWNGVALFNWSYHGYPTPQEVLAVLSHEGMHSLDARMSPKDRFLGNAVSYWYQENGEYRPYDYVTGYSSLNVDEYIAEISEYWHRDAEAELKKALQYYGEGHDGLLTELLGFALSGYADRGPQNDKLVLYRIDENGKYAKKSIEGNWTLPGGSLQGGAFRFVLDGTVYETVFLNYDIVSVTATRSNPFDANNDGKVTPIDALKIINRLNDKGPGPTYLGDPLDVSGDGYIAPMDVLLIVNYLNMVGAQGEAPSLANIGFTGKISAREAQRSLQSALKAMNTQRGAPGYRAAYDVDKNGVINWSDITWLNAAIAVNISASEARALSQMTVTQTILDSRGRLTQKVTYNAQTLRTALVENYNTNGKLTSRQIYDSRGRVDRIEYLDPSTGRVIRVIRY